MNKIVKKIILVVVVILALSLGKDALVKAAIQGAAGAVTGMPVKMSGFHMGLIKTVVDISNLRIYNPREFHDPLLLQMPKVYVDYDLPAVFKGVVHVKSAKMHLKELTVVRNEKGKLNIDSLTALQKQKEKTPAKPAPKEKGKAPKIQIDRLELKVERVVYKEYSTAQAAPRVTNFDIGLDETYEHVNDPNVLASLIVSKALMNTALSSLPGVRALEGSVSQALVLGRDQAMALAKNGLTESTAQAQKLMSTGSKQVQNTVADGAKNTEKAVKGFLSALKGDQ